MVMRVAFQRMSVLAGVSLTFFGCGQSTAPQAPSSQASNSKDQASKYDVRVTSGTSKTTRSEETRAVATEPVTAEPSNSATKRTTDPGVKPLSTAANPLDDLPVGDLTMPVVAMTKAHQESCNVLVGDTFPDLQLADLQGQKQSLASLLGKKLTVVAFWNGRQPSAREELADLGPRIAARFAENGVAVVAINSGDETQLASELASQAGARFANLSDPDGAALAQVGTGKIPRTYLLDSAGKIVWMDIEYSRSTRRDLNQAIHFLLAN